MFSEYEYKGFIYMPVAEDEYDADGVPDNRKIYHDIYKAEDVQRASANASWCGPAMSSNHTPYAYMTKTEFEEYIDEHLAKTTTH